MISTQVPLNLAQKAMKAYSLRLGRMLCSVDRLM